MSNKRKLGLIIALCVLAVIIAIAAIALAPFGRKATGSSDSPNITESVESTQAASTTTAESPEETSSQTSSAADTTIFIPPSTEPVVNPNKNYTLFIDKTMFDSSESDDGTLTLTAKKDGAVKMTVTPIKDMGYKECCRAVEKNHKKLGSSSALKIANTNTVYRSQTGDGEGDIITTVYCVDDKKGGCIVIECRVPVGATSYMETIEIMLSMFKVI